MKERRKAITWYTPTGNFLVNHVKKQENMKYGCYQAPLDTRAGWIGSGIRLEGPYSWKLHMPKTGGGFLITQKDCPAQMGCKDFGHCTWRNPGYSVTVSETVEYTIWIAPGSQKHVSYSDDQKANLCELIKMEEVKLPRECVFTGHGNMLHESAG